MKQLYMTLLNDLKEFKSGHTSRGSRELARHGKVAVIGRVAKTGRVAMTMKVLDSEIEDSKVGQPVYREDPIDL